MGIGTSGVREIAEAQGVGDQELVSATVKGLHRTVWVTGFLGMAAMVIGCALFSRSSFGTYGYALPIALLGVTIFCWAISPSDRPAFFKARGESEIWPG